jgi:hypothetical protein
MSGDCLPIAAASSPAGPDGGVIGSARGTLTVGDLKSELSRCSDETPVTSRSPLQEEEFRFYRYQPGENLLVLEINEFPETSPVALPGADMQEAWAGQRSRTSRSLEASCSSVKGLPSRLTPASNTPPCTTAFAV